MKKSILALCLLGSVFLHAQSRILDTALVSASRLNTSLQSSNRNVQVIEGDEIANAPANSVAELLDFVTGIDARQRGIFGTQTDLSIRGGTFEQVLVLVNGVRVSDPQTGHHLMNLPVQKKDIERIEVLLGGGSYIFGGNAFSGAINIITKDGAEDKATAKAMAGSFGSYQASFSQQLVGTHHQTRLSINTAGSEGFKPNTDFNNTNLYGQSYIQLGENQLNLSGGYTWQDFGAQNFYSNNFPEQYEKTRTLFVNAGLKSGDNITIDRQVYWRRNWDEFQLYREGPGFYEYNNGLFIKGTDTAASFYTGHNYHRSDVLGGKTEVQFRTSWGKTSLGAEYRFEEVVSNNLGEALEAPISIAEKRGVYSLGASRHNVSFSGQHYKKVGKFDLSAALLVNYTTAFQPGVYPALTAGYNFNRHHKLYSSFNRSFRLPSYTDLYYRLGGAVGSKDLQPENSLNYELGYKFLSDNYFFNLSVYRRQGTDIIDWIRRCDTCNLVASNTAQVNFSGADMTYRLTGLELQKQVKMDFLELGYSFITTDNEDPAYESLYAFDYLTHKAVLRSQHSLLKGLKLSYTLSYQQRNGAYTDAASGELLDYPLIVLIDTRLMYQWKNFGFSVSGQNLLNKTYYDRGNVQLPGAWFWTGMEVSL
ncbi:MAG: TonB-dependent receptor [Owenweeksia sp.]